MQAMVIERNADVRKLAWQEMPSPVPESRDLLIKVKTASVNRAGLLRSRGKYPAGGGVGRADCGRSRGGGRGGGRLVMWFPDSIFIQHESTIALGRFFFTNSDRIEHKLLFSGL